MTSRAILLSTVVATGCARGNGARDPDGGATEGDSVGSAEVTADTIDPTQFSTSAATEASGSEQTAATEVTDGPDTSASADTQDTTGVGDGPTVVGVTPDGVQGVDPDGAITVTFSAAMDPSTITADDGDCTGAIQLSDDDFASCVALADVAGGDGDTAFTVTPAATLGSARTYRVRATTAAQAADGAPLAIEFTSEGFVSRYHHTIQIDGVDDWNGDEGLATSTAGHVALVAWDAEFVYVGMRSPDIALGNPSVWAFFYFGGAAGTDTGVLYNTQSPALPFAAQFHLRWRADNIYTDVLAFDGDAWSPGGWAIGDGDVYQQGELLEMRVARADLGDPTTLELHGGLLREAMLDEATWAGCPEGSYVDGYDPDYTQYWSFDLSGSDSPAQHVPLP